MCYIYSNHEEFARMLMNPSFKRVACLALGLILLAGAFPAWADDTSASDNPMQQTGSVLMLGWANSLGIVEQLQAIHRMGQGSPSEALQALVTALESPFQLARRKASRSLLDKCHAASSEDKQMLAQSLKDELKDTDPVVQKNLIRTMADLNIPESRDALKAFFTSANMAQQLDAVDALSIESNAAALSLAKQYSAFPEIRSAAESGLK